MNPSRKALRHGERSAALPRLERVHSQVDQNHFGPNSNAVRAWQHAPVRSGDSVLPWWNKVRARRVKREEHESEAGKDRSNQKPS